MDHLLENNIDDVDPKDLTPDLSPSGQLIFLGHTEDGDFKVECPVCHFQGDLMKHFNLLSPGFNGIERNDIEAADVQECGNCGARLQDDSIPY